ncbi:hypothetical protein UT300005_14860 [Clostridium sp. CTA-5]
MKDILRLAQESFLNSKPCERIVYLRRYLNMTQKEFAEKCIISEKCVWNWEKGHTFPTKRNQKIIASVLGVNEKTIFGSPKEYKF